MANRHITEMKGDDVRIAISFIALIFLLGGCSGSPPKPPEPKGEYRPVNKLPRIDNSKNEGLFRFKYEGDLSGTLAALHEVKPALKILAPVGKVRPVAISVNVANADIEAALTAIAEQCGDAANVIYQTRRDPEMHQAYIEYRESK